MVKKVVRVPPPKADGGKFYLSNRLQHHLATTPVPKVRDATLRVELENLRNECRSALQRFGVWT